MSPARLQDTSIHINQLYFYIPAINNQKKKNPFTIASKRITGINVTKEI